MVYFKKSFPEPQSLIIERNKKNGNYKSKDVLDQLYEDFHNKCYICEAKGIEGINVEHFAPHMDIHRIRKYNWSNLFWACSHCNQIKSNTHINLLNCTVNEDNVCSNINYDVDSTLSGNKIVITAKTTDIETQNTVKLLQEVYSGTTIQNKFQASTKRDNIYDELCDFTNLIKKYNLAEDKRKKNRLLDLIIYELSNDSIYTAFKRSYIYNNRNLSFLAKYI